LPKANRPSKTGHCGDGTSMSPTLGEIGTLAGSTAPLPAIENKNKPIVVQPSRKRA
jgi:hypothetical protein